jgi:hypothetical protein
VSEKSLVSWTHTVSHNRFSHRAGQLAPAAVFDDFYRVVKPVDRLCFGRVIVLFHLHIADRAAVMAVPSGKNGLSIVFNGVLPFVECLLGTGSPAEFHAVPAGIELPGAGGKQIRIHGQGPQPNPGAEFRRDQDVVFADTAQARHDRGILEIGTALFNMIGKVQGLDAEAFFNPWAQFPADVCQDPVARGIFAAEPPVHLGLVFRMKHRNDHHGPGIVRPCRFSIP